MDRRGFLKTGGAAAVAAGAAAPASATEQSHAQAPAMASPAVLSGVRELTLTSSWAGILPGSGPERLAHRIETATEGRIRIKLAADGADTDMTFGPASGPHAAFAYFAGLPFAHGLDHNLHVAWLTAGGGQMLWDELAGDYGFKPLLAGHTGPSGGVWANRRLESTADLAGASVYARGLALDTLRAVGARPSQLDARGLKAALAEGRIVAAEWLGPLGAVSGDLQPLSDRLYLPGFHRAGAALALTITTRAWSELGSAGRAVVEGCAAHEFQLSLADAQAHALIAAQVTSIAKRPVRQPLSTELEADLDVAFRDIAADLANGDASARRIHDSHEGFRKLSSTVEIA